MSAETDILEKLERLDNLRRNRPEYSDVYMNRLKEQLVREYMVFDRKKGDIYNDLLSSFKSRGAYRDWYGKEIPAALKRNYKKGRILHRELPLIERMVKSVMTTIEDCCVLPIFNPDKGDSENHYIIMPNGMTLEI